MADDTTQAQGAPASQDQGSTAPWSADLEQRFTDPAVRSQVDAYLREVQQPRMTKLEQQVAASQDATNLWSALAESPYETLVTMIDQMFDADTAQAVYSALSGEQGPEAQAAATQAVTDAVKQEAVAPPQAASQQDVHSGLTDQQQALLDRLEQQEAEKAYWSELDGLLGREDFKDLNNDLTKRNIHPFIAATDGDMERALAMYRDFVGQFGPPATDAEVEANGRQNGPPPVHDGTGAASNGAGTEHKQSWDEAFADFDNDLKASRQLPAPPVGTV